MKLRKIISTVLAGAMMSSFVLSGCSQKPTGQNDSKPDTNTTSNTSVESKTEAKTPDKITFFMGTAGLKFKEGCGTNDNDYIKKIAELANVEFTEVIVPEYADFQTKFNLMISSGDIPDLVHNWFPNDVQLQGDAGAFLPLNDIIANSPVLSKNYSSSMINLMKDEKGNIYALRSLPPLDTNSAAINPWLIQEINDGVVPTNPQDWVEVFKKLKAKYPDAVPFSAIGGLDGLELFFKAYGASVSGAGVGWQLKDSKIINGLQAPLVKDAIIFYQNLYKQGLLDKTFVTNKGEEYHDRIDNKNMILWSNNTNSCIGKKVVPAALPRFEDPRVTDDDAYYAMELVGGHNIAIGATTKQKDAAVRVIETLLSDEVKILSSWGIEGKDYKVVDGKKELIPEYSDTTFGMRSMYRMMWSYGNDQSVAIATSRLISMQEEGKRDYYAKMLNKGIEDSYALARKAKPNPANYIQLSPDTQTKIAEAQEVSKTIIVKAILGEISMDDFDKQAEAFNKKYQFIADEYNAKLPEMMEKLK